MPDNKTHILFKLNKFHLSRSLMVGTILLIIAFQCYWIKRLYTEEWQNLRRETDILFRDVVYKLQLQRFRQDTTFFKPDMPDNLFVFNVIDSVKGQLIDSALQTDLAGTKREVRISVNASRMPRPLMDSATTAFIHEHADSSGPPFPPSEEIPRLVRYFSSGKAINDSLSIGTIDSAYRVELSKNNIDVPFTVTISSGKERDLKTAIGPDELKTNFTFVGLSSAYAYQAAFDNPFWFIVYTIRWPLVLSVLIIAVTIVSFVFLYRNLLEQRRLTAMKNEFISNITHELKTPIATVHVAIEAMRNFNALQHPERTKEYLDISASELQRLSLLVDKVLRLSMFENKEIELRKEPVDLHLLAAEIIAGMKLQFDKVQAVVQLTKEGNNFTVSADKVHISSVLYNLLDNALKYRNGKPYITVHLAEDATGVTITVSDNGIGIPAAYQEKVFDKFFRVPSFDHHNIKGYGLGLSYVHHIVEKHKGSISVTSTEGKGSSFIVKLPRV